MNRVVHFEISAQDPERVTTFYREVFGWEINKWDGPQDYWLIETGKSQPGIDGAIMRKMDPSAGVINTIGVAELDDSLERVTGSGGSVLSEIMTIPNVGRFAYCKDPEGNMFGLMQFDQPSS